MIVAIQLCNLAEINNMENSDGWLLMRGLHSTVACIRGSGHSCPGFDFWRSRNIVITSGKLALQQQQKYGNDVMVYHTKHVVFLVEYLNVFIQSVRKGRIPVLRC